MKPIQHLWINALAPWGRSGGRPRFRGRCGLVLAIFAGVLASVPLSARAAVVVTLPKAGEYVGWVNANGGKDAIAGPVRAEGAKIVLDTGTTKNPGDWSILVQDPGGNAAMQPVPKGDSPRVALKSEMFNRIAKVVATVTDTDGAAPDYATVTLIDSKGKGQNAMLSPDDAGRAVFHNVLAGDAKLRVQQGDISNQQTVTVRLPAERETPVLALSNKIQLPDGMKTTTAKGDGTNDGASKQDADKATPVNTSSSFMSFLIALVVLGIVGWIAYSIVRRRGITAKSMLAAAGVQLPEDDPKQEQAVLAVAPDAVDPTVCPFCGATKDPLGVCPRCGVAAGALANATAPVSGGGGRRLVAVSGPRAGTIYPLTGPISIGRDPGEGIAIPEDAALSRHHAALKPMALGTEIIDQNSSNGTWINGQKVQDRATLQAGDELTVGGSRFRYEA